MAGEGSDKRAEGMPAHFTRIIRLAAVLLTLAVILAACGGDGSGDSDDISNQPGAQPAAPSGSSPTQMAEPTSVEPGEDTAEMPEAASPDPGDNPSDAPEPTAADPSDDPSGVSEPTAADEPVAESPAPEPEAVELAPEFGSIDSWHNSEPVTLADLRGSPVLLVFWADF